MADSFDQVEPWEAVSGFVLVVGALTLLRWGYRVVRRAWR